MNLKKSKGYILTEILIGSVLQAVFIVSLAASVYWLTMFSLRAHYILLAREKGERIVAHIDNRIKNCGYGLWRCQTPHDVKLSSVVNNGILGKAFGFDSGHQTIFSNHKQVVRIYRDPTADPPKKFSDENADFQHGIGFSILYTNTNGYILKADSVQQLSDGNRVANFTRLSSYNNKIFSETVRAWGVIPSFGIAFGVGFNGENISLTEYIDIDVDLPPIVEIFQLKEDLFYVNGRNFIYKKRDMDDIGEDWGGNNPYVNDVLRIYCEWDRTTQIFNLYILSSGGTKPLGMTEQERPSNWSSNDTEFANLWESTFKKDIVYVTRASWKLHNIP